jgi:hypothetical protein
LIMTPTSVTQATTDFGIWRRLQFDVFLSSTFASLD